MSGIGGLATVDAARVPGRDALQRLMDALRHRGPGEAGIHTGPGVGVAVCRHADDHRTDADGHRNRLPHASPDGTVVLVVDGAFHDTRDVRRELEAKGHRFPTGEGAEIAIALYLDRGLDFLHGLRGSFALALWDARERRLVLARDRVGARSLVYAETPAALVFASEAKGLLAAGWVEPRPDAGAVDQLFRLGSVHAPRTAFEGIRALLPGECLVHCAGASRRERWWDVGRDPVDAPRSAAGWAEGLRERLARSVGLALEDAPSLAAWLSGGLDSSAVTALAARSRSGPLDAVTLAFEDPALDETSAGTLAELSTLDIRARRATVGEEGFADLPRAVWHTETPALYAIEVSRLALARATAAAGHREALSGEGADAILGGGWWAPLDRWFGPLAGTPRWMRERMLVGPLSGERHLRAARAWLAPPGPPFDRYEAIVGPRFRVGRSALYAPEFRARVEESVRQGPAVEESVGEIPEAIALSPIEYVHLKLHLPDFTLRPLERTSQACGIDVRLPFLDHEVVEYAARIPARLKLRPWSRKGVLQEAMRGILPEELRRRRKRGLAAPIDRWLAGPLPGYAAALLSPDSLRAKGYFDAAHVRALLAAHREGTRRAVPEIMGVLTVQMWDDIFVAGRRPWSGEASC